MKSSLLNTSQKKLIIAIVVVGLAVVLSSTLGVYWVKKNIELLSEVPQERDVITESPPPELKPLTEEEQLDILQQLQTENTQNDFNKNAQLDALAKLKQKPSETPEKTVSPINTNTPDLQVN